MEGSQNTGKCSPDSTNFHRDFCGDNGGCLQYLREEVAASAAEAPKHLHGRDALLIKFAKLEEKHDKNVAKLEEVEEILAPPKRRQTSASMAKDFVAADARGHRP